MTALSNQKLLTGITVRKSSIAWTGNKLILGDYNNRTVYSYDYDHTTGVLSNERRIISIRPDGLIYYNNKIVVLHNRTFKQYSWNATTGTATFDGNLTRPSNFQIFGIEVKDNKFFTTSTNNVYRYDYNTTTRVLSNEMHIRGNTIQIGGGTFIGNKLILSNGNNGNLYEYDYDANANTISNETQLTGETLTRAWGLQWTGSKLLVASEHSGGVDIYQFDYPVPTPPMPGISGFSLNTRYRVLSGPAMLVFAEGERITVPVDMEHVIVGTIGYRGQTVYEKEFANTSRMGMSDRTGVSKGIWNRDNLLGRGLGFVGKENRISDGISGRVAGVVRKNLFGNEVFVNEDGGAVNKEFLESGRFSVSEKVLAFKGYLISGVSMFNEALLRGKSFSVNDVISYAEKNKKKLKTVLTVPVIAKVTSDVFRSVGFGLIGKDTVKRDGIGFIDDKVVSVGSLTKGQFAGSERLELFKNVVKEDLVRFRSLFVGGKNVISNGIIMFSNYVKVRGEGPLEDTFMPKIKGIVIKDMRGIDRFGIGDASIVGKLIEVMDVGAFRGVVLAGKSVVSNEMINLRTRMLSGIAVKNTALLLWDDVIFRHLDFKDSGRIGFVEFLRHEKMNVAVDYGVFSEESFNYLNAVAEERERFDGYLAGEADTVSSERFEITDYLEIGKIVKLFEMWRGFGNFIAQKTMRAIETLGLRDVETRDRSSMISEQANMIDRDKVSKGLNINDVFNGREVMELLKDVAIKGVLRFRDEFEFGKLALMFGSIRYEINSVIQKNILKADRYGYADSNVVGKPIGVQDSLTYRLKRLRVDKVVRTGQAIVVSGIIMFNNILMLSKSSIINSMFIANDNSFTHRVYELLGNVKFTGNFNIGKGIIRGDNFGFGGFFIISKVNVMRDVVRFSMEDIAEKVAIMIDRLRVGARLISSKSGILTDEARFNDRLRDLKSSLGWEIMHFDDVISLHNLLVGLDRVRFQNVAYRFKDLVTKDGYVIISRILFDKVVRSTDRIMLADSISAFKLFIEADMLRFRDLFEFSRGVFVSGLIRFRDAILKEVLTFKDLIGFDPIVVRLNRKTLKSGMLRSNVDVALERIIIKCNKLRSDVRYRLARFILKARRL